MEILVVLVSFCLVHEVVRASPPQALDSTASDSLSMVAIAQDCDKFFAATLVLILTLSQIARWLVPGIFFIFGAVNIQAPLAPVDGDGLPGQTPNLVISI